MPFKLDRNLMADASSLLLGMIEDRLACPTSLSSVTAHRDYTKDL